MTAQPADPGETYEMVPASRLRYLEAIEKHAPAAALAAARAEVQCLRVTQVSARWLEIAATADPERTARVIARLEAQATR